MTGAVIPPAVELPFLPARRRAEQPWELLPPPAGFAPLPTMADAETDADDVPLVDVVAAPSSNARRRSNDGFSIA